MSIVASVVLEDAVQVDGRRAIRERHTDHLGEFHFRAYVAEAGFDAAAALAARALALVDELRVVEFYANLARVYAAGPLAVLTFNHSTAAEERVLFRAMYKTLAREQAMAVGAFLNTLSLAQIALIFELANPSAELTALKARLTTKATQWADYISAAGE